MDTMNLQNYFSNIGSTLPTALFFWGILIFSMWRDRSRYRNCVFLAFAMLSSIPVVTSFAGPYQNKAILFINALILFLIMIVPVLLIANGLQMRKKEGRSFANLLSMLMGIGIGIGELCAYGLAALLVLYENNPEAINGLNLKVLSLLLIVSMSCVYFSLSFVNFMLYSLFLGVIPRKRDFDYVIIHGAGLIDGHRVSKLLADRIDKAIEIYRKDPSPPIMIPSGGKGGDESISEAEAIANYLIEKGIPHDHIILEDRSKTTMENLQFSKAILDGRDGRKYTALVTSNYHVYRALRYARKIGLKATGIGATVARYYWPSALIREYIAIHYKTKHMVFLMLGWLMVIFVPALLFFA